MRPLSILLSLLAPGTGQLMLGRIARGVAFAVVSAAMPYTLPMIGVWSLIGWGAIRVVAAIDAGLGARERGHGLAAGLTAGGQGIAAFVWMRIFALESFRERSAAMEPTLHDGDHLMVSRLAYHLGSIARGDVITFHDPCGRDVTFVSRVVALAGDTVEVRCQQLYLDGALVPDELVGDTSYDDLAEGTRRTERTRATRWHEQLDDARFDILGTEDRASLAAHRATIGGGDYLEYQDPQDFPPIDGAVTPAGECTAPSPSSFVRTIDRPAHPCDPQLHYVVPAGTVFTISDNRDDAVDSRRFGAVPTDHVIGRYWLTWWHDRKK